jgi:hypothetical protein
MRPVVARVTTANPTAYIRLDQYHGAALAVSAVIESGATGAAAYQIDISFDDPNDLINPVPLASVAWDNSLVPIGAQQATASVTFVVPTAPIWARVQLLAGASSVRVIFTQYEAHRTFMVAEMPPSQMLQLP